MNNLAEQMSALDITQNTNLERVEYLPSPIIKEIFQDGLDIYNQDDKWVILGVPNLYCSKYFDDEDFIYARMKFSDSLDDEIDLNPVSYIQFHNLSITPLDLSLHPNTIFAKILYIFQHVQSYYTSLRHLRPLERVSRIPSNLLELINNSSK